jgi:anthranilate phosphoribosyltransferase
MVVHSQGLDEISNLGETIVYELDQYSTKHQKLKPSRPCTLDDLRVNSPEESAARIKEVLAGKRNPVRDAIVRNAGAAIYLGTDPRISMECAVMRAEETINSGAAASKLARIVEYSRSF